MILNQWRTHNVSAIHEGLEGKLFPVKLLLDDHMPSLVEQLLAVGQYLIPGVEVLPSHFDAFTTRETVGLDHNTLHA